jgi:hypothetical protein
MRSAGAGLFGALLMVAPLVAIPIFAVVGVPQFAPAVSPDGGERVESGSFDDTLGADEFGEEAPPTASRSRSARKGATRSAKRRAADDLYAPLPEPLATGEEVTDSAPSAPSAPSAARPWRDEASTDLPELSDSPASRRPRDYAAADRSKSAATEAPRPSRKLWSNTSPRGSLGEWELDESTGAPAADRDEAFPPAESQFETAPPDDASEWDSNNPEPLTEAGAINFLARTNPGRQAPPRGRDESASRTASTGTERAAPRRGGRPIPADDFSGDDAGTDFPEMSNPVTEAGGTPPGFSDPGFSDEESFAEDETDNLSESELQRGLNADPLSARPRPSKPAPRTAPLDNAGVLDFPDPSDGAFADATPLRSETSRSPATPAENEDRPSAIAEGAESPAVESMTWKQATAQLKTWGIRKYRLEADPETEGFVFVCMAPDPNSTKVTRRFEATGSDPLSTVRSAIGQISEWYASRTRRE